MARTFSKRGHGCINHIGTGFNSLEDGHGTHAARAVGVNIDRYMDFFLKGRNEVVAGVRSKQAGHIFDADGISPHFFQFLGKLHKIAVLVIRTDGINKRTLGMGTGFLDGLHGAFQVPCIIKGIKNADNINAVCHASFNEFRNDIVCIVVIAQEVLTAKQHLQFGILHMAADGAQAFPGIFIQEAKAGVKRSTAPCFECVEAAII